jgi:hypothetical protein
METPEEANGSTVTEDLGLDGMSGAFVNSLKRNNKQIKTERAIMIAEGTELIFKRTVEDIELRLKDKRRERAAQLDMSPENTHSLVVAKDFNPRAWVDKDLNFSMEIRNLEIELEIAKGRYQYLFGA